MRPFALLAGGLTLVLLAAGCRTGFRRGEALGRPVVPETAAEAHGRVVYMRHCYRCHQGGEGGLGPALNYPLPDWVIRLQVRRGLGAMPAYPADVISDTDLEDLLAYLKAVRRS
jgi:mono/diheme cytochrome c family protein